ncbi:unnamed protein product [Victoria cruziana]
MLGCDWLCWSRSSVSDGAWAESCYEPKPFSLPSPIPSVPAGGGFATGRIHIGEIELAQVTELEKVWSCTLLQRKNRGVTVYKPVRIPDGFHCLGYYCQPNDEPLRASLLLARDLGSSKEEKSYTTVLGLGNHCTAPKSPALQKPLNYISIWRTDGWNETNYSATGYFWLPCPPDGYKAMGCVVTNNPDKPSTEEVRCVRADLTESCETYSLMLELSSFQVWNVRPFKRGMWEKSVSVGTFFCTAICNSDAELSISCLKNVNLCLHAMPSLNQIHALIRNYGPTVFFHPDEIYLPSAVSWFFENGALLCRRGYTMAEAIDSNGSNLPCDGSNDGEYWIDLPCDDRRHYVKLGNIENAELYVHVKPVLAGTFTDIAMWVFCPFNGPATLKIGLKSISLGKIGQHVGDWEHFTLRINNFTGELWSIYYSQHSSGEWVAAYDLEYIEGNKAAVYSSRNGHASFPRPGVYLQGSSRLGIGIRNDAARSDLYVDSSVKYKIVSAEYLGDGGIEEPCWINYMREWGPKVTYNSRAELEKIIGLLPVTVRFTVENIFNKLPTELYGEEGPTGPKEKNNWVGDERD